MEKDVIARRVNVKKNIVNALTLEYLVEIYANVKIALMVIAPAITKAKKMESKQFKKWISKMKAILH